MENQSINSKFITVNGKSMYPYLKQGDLIRIEGPISVNQMLNIPLGKLIIFNEKSSKKQIIHRLVSKNPILFKGDNRKHFDQSLFEELEFWGIAKDRVIINKKKESHTIPLGSTIMERIIVQLSKVNLHKFVISHRVFSLLIKSCGLIERIFEIMTAHKLRMIRK